MKPADLPATPAERTTLMNVAEIQAAIAKARGTAETEILGDRRSVVAKVLQGAAPAAVETVIESALDILIEKIATVQTPYDRKLDAIRQFDFSAHAHDLARVFAASLADPGHEALDQAILDRTKAIAFPAHVVLNILKQRRAKPKFQQAIVERIDTEEDFNPETALKIMAAISFARTIETFLKKLRLEQIVQIPVDSGSLSPSAGLEKLLAETDPKKKSEIIANINPFIGFPLEDLFALSKHENASESQENKEKIRKLLNGHSSTFIRLLAATDNPTDIAALFQKYNITLTRSSKKN